jgi:hypothetical protein
VIAAGQQVFDDASCRLVFADILCQVGLTVAPATEDLYYLISPLDDFT